MTVRSRVAAVAALVVAATVGLAPAPAAGTPVLNEWVAQRCLSGHVHPGLDRDGRVRVVGQLDCRRQVPGATWGFAWYRSDAPVGYVAGAFLHPYHRTAPTAYDLGRHVETSGRWGVCLVTSPRVRLSCFLLTATRHGGESSVTVTRISRQHPLVRRPVEVTHSPIPVCGTCW